jgi:hypothetical protein
LAATSCFASRWANLLQEPEHPARAGARLPEADHEPLQSGVEVLDLGARLLGRVPHLREEVDAHADALGLVAELVELADQRHDARDGRSEEPAADHR